MAISINPVLPVLAAQEAGGVAPELVLQPGSVVNAQVLKVLDANLVRIAIAALSIDVLTEIPLQEGQALQLAVSQTKDGIRLALVGQGGDAGRCRHAVAGGAGRCRGQPPDDCRTLQERTDAGGTRGRHRLRRRAAATEQDSLAPLFANLGAAVPSGSLPPKLQQAIAQVLAQQTSLDQNLDGGDIKTAFQKSGIFLEASLAAGSVPSSGVPDLKAALIVLRQTLQSALGADGTTATQGGAGTGRLVECRSPGLVPYCGCRSRSPGNPAAAGAAAGRRGIASNARRPQGALAAALDAGPSAGATLNLLQEALQELGNPARAAAMPKAAPGDDVTVHTNTPPPPFRGALPTAQPVASPSLAPDAPLATTAHHLLDDTDAAIARQTLLQVASLPDRIDGSGPKIDVTTPRWNFEIPFVTPQGTAMAQFEISRDGGGQRGRSRQAGMARAVFARRRADRARSMRWCRWSAKRPRCGCGRSGPRPPRNCAPAQPN